MAPQPKRKASSLNPASKTATEVASQLNDLISWVNEKGKEVSSTKRQCTLLQQKYEGNKAELKVKDDRIAKLENEVITLIKEKVDIEISKSESKQLQEEIFEFKNEVKKLRKKNMELAGSVTELSTDKYNLQSEIQALKYKLDKVSEALKKEELKVSNNNELAESIIFLSGKLEKSKRRVFELESGFRSEFEEKLTISQKSAELQILKENTMKGWNDRYLKLFPVLKTENEYKDESENGEKCSEEVSDNSPSPQDGFQSGLAVKLEKNPSDVAVADTININTENKTWENGTKRKSSLSMPNSGIHGISVDTEEGLLTISTEKRQKRERFM